MELLRCRTQGQDFYSVSFRPVNLSMEYVPFLVRLVLLMDASAPHAFGHGVSPMSNAQGLGFSPVSFGPVNPSRE